MCRLYGFMANEPTKVDCSLVFAQNALMMQSRVDESGRDHADGWGIATYQDGKPVLQKKTTAAFVGQHFSAAAEKVYSNTIIAHVRKATVGETSVQNTHPFVSGVWAFAHNGTVTGFDQVRRQMEQETKPELQKQRLGQTDSEQYFVWLLSHLLDSQLDPNDTGSDSEFVELFRKQVIQLDERCRTAAPDETPRLNFLLTNGRVMFACRWNHSLHRIRREGIYNCEICGIPHIHQYETVNHRAVAIASEPVTHEDWEEIVDHSVFAERVGAMQPS